MSDLATFGKELDKFEEEVAIEHSNVCARAAIVLFAKIVSRTPYRTGQARSSWQIAIGAPNRNVNVPGNYPQYAEPSAAYALAVAEATHILASYKFSLLGFKPAIWITNRLRYIPFLERGTSKQAPAGMVRLSVEEVKVNFGQIAKVSES
ncbi:MAG: hypothetical protein HRU82_03420 [Nitrospira sp.]|nr:MAG: hypothetical protein HRU82_03420 [Nitrospira sp.]